MSKTNHYICYVALVDSPAILCNKVLCSNYRKWFSKTKTVCNNFVPNGHGRTAQETNWNRKPECSSLAHFSKSKKTTQNPEIPKTPRSHKLFAKFARTFACFPVTWVRKPTDIAQKNLFRWTFLSWVDLFGWPFLPWFSGLSAELQPKPRPPRHWVLRMFSGVC